MYVVFFHWIFCECDTHAHNCHCDHKRESERISRKHYPKKTIVKSSNYWHTEPLPMCCCIRAKTKWGADEIWKLHDIKMNLISTLPLIDCYSICIRFSLLSSKSPLTFLHFNLFSWMRIMKTKEAKTLLLSIKYLHKY